MVRQMACSSRRLLLKNRMGKATVYKITSKPHLKPQKNQNRRAPLGWPAMKLLEASFSFCSGLKHFGSHEGFLILWPINIGNKQITNKAYDESDEYSTETTCCDTHGCQTPLKYRSKRKPSVAPRMTKQQTGMRL